MIVKLPHLIVALNLKAFSQIQGEDVFLTGLSIHLLMVYEGCCELKSRLNYLT